MPRPLGPRLAGWTPADFPQELDLHGRWAHLTVLDPDRDAPGLWQVFAGQDRVWDYLFEPPPADPAVFRGVLDGIAAMSDRCCLVVRARDDPAPLGYACYWTIVPQMGSNEIGNVNFSPALQRTPAATEAFFLMLDWAFSHGYRRMEWKCNALNAPSRRAAQRLGFSYEGVFRQHMIVKGRNRDTAWFAITDRDWKGLRPAFQTWLAPDNFDAKGRQRQALGGLTAPYLVARDPGLAN